MAERDEPRDVDARTGGEGERPRRLPRGIEAHEIEMVGADCVSARDDDAALAVGCNLGAVETGRVGDLAPPDHVARVVALFDEGHCVVVAGDEHRRIVRGDAKATAVEAARRVRHRQRRRSPRARPSDLTCEVEFLEHIRLAAFHRRVHAHDVRVAARVERKVRDVDGNASAPSSLRAATARPAPSSTRKKPPSLHCGTRASTTMPSNEIAPCTRPTATTRSPIAARRTTRAFCVSTPPNCRTHAVAGAWLAGESGDDDPPPHAPRTTKHAPSPHRTDRG